MRIKLSLMSCFSLSAQHPTTPDGLSVETRSTSLQRESELHPTFSLRCQWDIFLILNMIKVGVHISLMGNSSPHHLRKDANNSRSPTVILSGTRACLRAHIPHLCPIWSFVMAAQPQSIPQSPFPTTNPYPGRNLFAIPYLLI